jgi:hypothetical protein
MLIFLDTEFTDFVNLVLISIALVGEDGREVYAARNDFRREDCNDFVCNEILPILGRNPDVVCNREELGRRLRAWLCALAEPSIVILYYADDWTLLCDALLDHEHRELPGTIGETLHLAGDIVGDKGYQRASDMAYTRDWPRHHALEAHFEQMHPLNGQRTE